MNKNNKLPGSTFTITDMHIFLPLVITRSCSCTYVYIAQNVLYYKQHSLVPTGVCRINTVTLFCVQKICFLLVSKEAGCFHLQLNSEQTHVKPMPYRWKCEATYVCESMYKQFHLV